MSVGARRWVAISLSLALAAACGGDESGGGGGGASSEASGGQTVQIQVSSPVYFDASVALGLGMLEDAGLQVDLLPFPQGTAGGASGLAQAIARGDADIGATNVSGVLAVLQSGRDLRIFGKGASRQVNHVVLSDDVAERIEDETGVTPESPLEDRIRALEGLDIGTTTAGGAAESVYRAGLTDFGVDPDSVTWPQVGDIAAVVAALEQNDVDGVATVVPQVAVAINEGYGVMWINGAMDELPSAEGAYSTAWFANADFADENPDVLETVYEVLDEAQQIVRDDPDAAQEAVAEFFPDLDPEVLRTSLDIVGPVYVGPEIDEAGWDAVVEQFNAAAAEPLEGITFEDTNVVLG
jgi:NitT/TauT family transport system substrate-binding protein